MKILSQKMISIIISIVILVSSLSCAIGVFASAQNIAIDTTKNLIAGAIPITFTGSDVGNNHYNWQQIRTEKEGLANSELKFGYDFRVNENMSSKDTYWLPFTTKLTDGDTTTTQWIEPLADGKDFVITYELEDPINIESFSFKTTSNDSKTLKIYAGSDYTELFTNLLGTYTTANANIEGTVTTINTKYIMFVLSDPELYVSEIEVYGKETAPNVLTGAIPITFTGSDVGNNHYNWQQIRTEKEGLANSELKFGYDFRVNENMSSKDTYWLPFTTKLTDGDTTTTQWIEPLADGKDFVITYELEDPINIESFSFKTTSNDSKTLKIYAGSDYTELFTNLLGTYTTANANIEGTVTTVNTKYIMFVLSDPELYVSEIEVYGKVDSDNSAITFNEPNVLDGKLPVAFAPTESGKIKYGWTMVRTENSNNNKLWTYDIAAKEHIIQFENCASHLAKLTDKNADTNIWIQPEHCSTDVRYDNMYIIYELDAATDLEGFVINTSSNASKTVDVYAAGTYAELFNNRLETITTTRVNIDANLSAEDVKYVAFVLKTPGYFVSEIEVHGTAATQQEVTFTSENAIKGKMPIVYSSANSGETSYNWTETATNPDFNNRHLKFGYSVPINQPSNGMEDIIESWKPYITDLTDEKSYTGQWIEPARVYNPYDDFVIVYQLDELKTLEGFRFESICKDVRVKVYAAKTYNALFSNRNLIAELQIDEYIGSVTKAVDCGAEYVALVFDKPAFILNEFSVYAKDYVKPDYGTNLILNKDPMSIFVSNREYPLGSNGARLWANNPETGTNEMTMISKTMGWFTDDDFTKSIDWLHDGAQKYVSTKSHYKVIAYDFGNVSTLNKILVDSNMGGYDIYISENFNNLYKTESRVYSSGGDQMLPNGELDPATDLEPGENLIDVAGVTGRYMAIVITRANRLGVECYDAIAIREIQAYGTPGTNDVGDNLISGKTPIFIYRAEYGSYDVPLETYSVREGGEKTYTDGEYTTKGYVQFPNSGGTLVYSNGALVLIYYLDGVCDVDAFAMHSGYYYGPGGLDVYISEKFDILFDNESQVFTSGGETAEDGIYDVSKNLGSLQLNIKLNETKRGRYVAFVVTRIYDIGTYGASGILRLSELELFGDFISAEQLPSTTVTDKETGNTAIFNYQNPDDTLLFAAKGIASFRMVKVDDAALKTDRFKNILLQNRFKSISDAFKLEFLDKDNNAIDISDLEGESITFEYKLENDKIVRLGEIRNNSVYVIRDAQQYGNKIVLTSEELYNYVFMLLEPQSSENLNYNGIVIDSTTDSSDRANAGGTTENSSPDNVTDNTFNNNLQTENNSTANNTTDNRPSTNKPSTSNRQWVVVEVDDPLEWFWNIYDTFAANIWMLIICILILLLCIGGIVAQIIIYKKRRNK